MKRDSAHSYVALRYQIVIHFTPMDKSKQALLLNSEYKYPLNETTLFRHTGGEISIDLLF